MEESLHVIVARQDERIADLEEWRIKQNGTLEKIQNELQRLREDFGKRPTWGVTVIITTLSTMVSALGVYVLTNL